MFQMLRNIIINVFSKPATRRYPFSKREPFENARGCIDADIENCIFCGMCERKCPSNSIKVNKEKKTWNIQSFKCIVCNVCVDVCPRKCIKSNPEYRTPDYKKSRIELQMKEKVNA